MEAKKSSVNSALSQNENLEKKKIAKEANEALKELYGDDYEQPGQQ